VAKQKIVTGHVQISRCTREQEHVVDELLATEEVEIEIRPVGVLLDQHPQIREEGDVLVVPIVAEELVITRRLVLKEELRIRRVRGQRRYQQGVTVRCQEAVFKRFPAEEPVNKEPGVNRPEQITPEQGDNDGLRKDCRRLR
jgi:stress response protein YsnF